MVSSIKTNVEFAQDFVKRHMTEVAVLNERHNVRIQIK